jgi:hypothetical protein
MTGSVIISEVDAFMYVILYVRQKKTRALCKLGDTTECKRYIQAVAQTEIIITKFNCSLPFHIRFISPLPQACKSCIS